MRVVLAGLFVFIGLMAGIAVLSSVLPEDPPTVIVAVAMSTWMLLLYVAAFVIFNRAGTPPLGFQDPAAVIRQLEADGMLRASTFKARRAFQVEEFEDEGLHYFVELDDGSVLFLSGQYLYDYEPGGDDEGREERRFPSSEFTVRRHRDQGYVVDIQCRGETLEPEVVAPHFNEDDYRHERIPGDGQVVNDRSYAAIKQERTARSG